MKSVAEKSMKFPSLAVYGGFRKGEILAVTFSDFSFETGLLDISKASNSVTGYGTYTGAVKTKTSNRYVKLPEKVLSLVKQLQAEQEKNKYCMGDKWLDTDGRLFTQTDGKPMHGNTPFNWFKGFCKRNNMRFCNIHAFRHFHISALITGR